MEEQITVKCGNIKQFSMLFVNKTDYHNHMAPNLNHYCLSFPRAGLHETRSELKPV